MIATIEPRHYHLIGIGGTAMASLAGLLRAAGHRVTGSDAEVYPPMSTQLQEMGIEYASRQCEQLIQFGVAGVHFYSLNKSYSVQAICKNLGL